MTYQTHHLHTRRPPRRFIVEAGNAPLSVEADTVCHQRGIAVLPDILASAGAAVLCRPVQRAVQPCCA